jgi:hypothetical protein
MNTSIFRNTLLTLAALALPHTVNASLLLAGWHDFDGTVGNETPDYVASGFSTGTYITKGNVPESSATDPSSIDGFYGPDSVGAGGVATNQPASMDGRIANADGVQVVLKNSTTENYGLQSLLFDAVQNGLGNLVTYNVSYSTTDGDSGNLTVPNNTIGSVLPGAGTGYFDFIVDLSGIFLNAGETITFVFDTSWALTSRDGRLDNIAITAIPEPASLIGLGLVLGSGLLLRQRPRQITPGLA